MTMENEIATPTRNSAVQKQKKIKRVRREDMFKSVRVEEAAPVVDDEDESDCEEESEKTDRIRQLEQELAALKSAEQSPMLPKTKKKQPQKQQKIPERKKKPQKVKAVPKSPPKPKQSASYFAMVLDAKCELQRAFVRMSSLGNGDRVGAFLVFLFSCLYPTFERDFEGAMSDGCSELSRRYRQHIFQTLYDKFLQRAPSVIMSAPKDARLKLSGAAYLVRAGENVVSWRFMRSLPGMSETAATQLSGLFEMMLAMVEEGNAVSEEEFAPLKPWVEQMDFSFAEVYPLLLYIWIIVDVDLPAPPYPFIKPKVVKRLPDGGRVQQQAKRPQMSARRMRKKKQAKAKPVMLFKMGGM